MKSLFFPAILLLSLAGCATATSGQDFNMEAVQVLVPGVSTVDDAVRLMGASPVSVTNLGDGSKILGWTYIKAQSQFMSTTSQGKTAHLLFDANGIFVRANSTQVMPGVTN
ncbi:hypothetical protein ACMHYJ_02130 [Castellaniella hirudinis]|uniref:hypothetical protein n=1 Tax=Castellaniella hirudinis TaxID=1144617 RepID=UPI0039C4A41F